MKETPDWNETDLKKCELYDKTVAKGKMTYRTIELNRKMVYGEMVIYND